MADLDKEAYDRVLSMVLNAFENRVLDGSLIQDRDAEYEAAVRLVAMLV